QFCANVPPPESQTTRHIEARRRQLILHIGVITFREPPRFPMSASPSRSSNHQRPLRVVRRLRPHMLHPSLPVVSKKIEPQAVFGGAYLLHQIRPHPDPLGRVHQALKHRILHTLPAVLAHLRHSPQRAPAPLRLRIHVVRHHHQHHRVASPITSKGTVDTHPGRHAQTSPAPSPG